MKNFEILNEKLKVFVKTLDAFTRTCEQGKNLKKVSSALQPILNKKGSENYKT